MSRFVGTVNPAFGTSSVKSLDVSLPRPASLAISPFAASSLPREEKPGRVLMPGVCLQDIDFGALYKAYDDELMAWKSAIDERHHGEKTSKGALYLRSPPRAPRSRAPPGPQIPRL